MIITYINEHPNPYSETFVKAEKDILVKHGHEIININLKELNISFRKAVINGLNPINYSLSLQAFLLVLYSISNYRLCLSNLHAVVLFFSNLNNLKNIVRNSQHIRAHHLGKRAIFASLLGQAYKIPFSAVAHANDLYKWIPSIKIVIKKAAIIHTISNYNIGYINAKTKFVFSNKIILIRNSFPRNIDVKIGSDYLPAPFIEFCKSSHSLINKKVLFFTASRIVDSKGIIEWLQILKEMDRYLPFRMAIAGDGPLFDRVARLINDSGLAKKVSLCGVLSTDEIHKYIQAADYLVLTSKNATKKQRDMDGLPTIFFESMSYGTPIISTCVSGIPELIIHGFNGLLIDMRKPIPLLVRDLVNEIKSISFNRNDIQYYFRYYMGSMEGGEVLHRYLYDNRGN